MTIKFFWFPVSPPARFAKMTADALGIEMEVQVIDLTKGEQKQDWFVAINPNGQVPALQDGSFCLYESAAIARYLCHKKGHTSFYPFGSPADIAAVDIALESVKSKISDNVGKIISNLIIKPKFFNTPGDEKAIEEGKAALAKGLGEMENMFFKSSPNALATSSFTLADAFFLSWISQLEMMQYDLSPFPKVAAYYTENKENNAAFKSASEGFFGFLASQAGQS